MKKLFLFIILTISLNLVQAQQEVSYVQNINLQSFSKSDSLYHGHNHDYYNVIFEKATKQRNAGIIITSAGVGLFVGAQIASNTNLNTTAILFITSVAAISAGVPLWISGSVKRKNNRIAMEKIKRAMSISFRTSPNGLGFVLNF